VLASLACQALTGGSGKPSATPSIANTTSPDEPQPTAENSGDNSTNPAIDTDFPMTPDAYNVVQSGGSLIFYTKLSLQDAMKFYRDAYAAKGYKEREILTVVSDTAFSLVFDGDPSGKAVVVQSVDLGNGSRTISIRLEAVGS
jgi:hypothetical protein